MSMLALSARCGRLSTPKLSGPARFSSTKLLRRASLLRHVRAGCAFSPSRAHFSSRAPWEACDAFEDRHVGPDAEATGAMLKTLGLGSLDELIAETIPEQIRTNGEELLGLDMKGKSESEATAELRALAAKNAIFKSFIGQGYYGTKTPAVIMRNLIENPAWYTAYTPYQAEVAQGRLEMLLNFQTMVADLTAMELANCSLLDEGSAAAEAMNMSYSACRKKKPVYFVSQDCFPQTIACVQTRAESMGVEVVVGDAQSLTEAGADLSKTCGVLVQYPNRFGQVKDYSAVSEAVAASGGVMTVATDLLACSVAKPPGEFGADIVVGSAQRFGVPLFYGGPHAGFMAVKDEYKRLMPGRLIGVSKDSQGNPALRMALQTREQFIKRDKATSNICTAQALLANVAAAYGIYHGPDGLEKIAYSVHGMATALLESLEAAGFSHALADRQFFDTLTLNVPSGDSATAVVERCRAQGMNILADETGERLILSVDETTTKSDLDALVNAMTDGAVKEVSAPSGGSGLGSLERSSSFMTHPIFHSHRSETQMMRYLASLTKKDVTLCDSMIALGSCTMKLNAAAELAPVSWAEFANLHPFAPLDQAEGYLEMIELLNGWLASLTGFAAVSTQPNSGATGEYAGLLCIKAYHAARGETHRDVCLIPMSAHGTNPASAVMAGMKVIGVKNEDNGDVCFDDVMKKIEKHRDNLAAMMITYPSTYGKFETKIKEIISKCHEHGGQVYMDGANMNAQLGLTSPGAIGADVCHLNLHKTFAIPHGGGGPGVGSIGVAKHLAPYLPGHVVVPVSGEGENVVSKANGQIAAAPYGSAGVLPISWMFIRMSGGEGLLRASKTAILNANYMAKRLENHYKVLFLNDNGRCAHEFIIDLRNLKNHGLSEDDVAKRLADYGFHAPTMSWPVPGTIMVEPTESESKEECDRLIDSLIQISAEIQEVIDGKADPVNNVLKNAPHTAAMVTSDEWTYPYSREQAAYPMPWLKANKFWPSVSRVDNVFGDRNLMCACPSVEEMME